ncbi:MAG: TonB family protein [Sulfurifustis sp.]
MNNHVIGFSVSVLLHSALLLLVLALAPPAPRMQKVVPLTLAMFETRPAVSPPENVAPPSYRHSPARAVRKPKAPRDTKPAVADLAPARPPTTEESPPTRADAKPSVPDPIPASPPSEPAAPPAPEESPPTVARAAEPAITSAVSPPDPNAMARYADALTGVIARHRSYPRQAQRRGWQGQVELQLHIAPDGRLVDAQVSRSSGFDVLDRQALEMARLARPLPEPPAPLRRKEFTVLVPVMFRLGG